MSRALLTLWNAKITADPHPGWAQSNSARQIRFPVMVVVKRGERFNQLYYQVSAYGKAAEFLIAKFEDGTLNVGDRLNLMCRVESHQTYPGKDGTIKVAMNVTALETEIPWVAKPDDEDEETT